jgi:hypothetical protein
VQHVESEPTFRRNISPLSSSLKNKPEDKAKYCINIQAEGHAIILFLNDCDGVHSAAYERDQWARGIFNMVKIVWVP